VGDWQIIISRRVFSAEKIEPNDVMFSAPREPPRKPTGFQSWGDRDETTEHFFPQKKSGGVTNCKFWAGIVIERGHFRKV
jgi:hypothetical protein